MILEALRGLAALPRLISAVETLSDIARVQVAQQRKDTKDEMVDDLIAAARDRRVRQREAERVPRDSGGTSGGDGESSGV